MRSSFTAAGTISTTFSVGSYLDPKTQATVSVNEHTDFNTSYGCQCFQLQHVMFRYVLISPHRATVCRFLFNNSIQFDSSILLLRGVITTRRYTNPRLPLPLPIINYLSVIRLSASFVLYYFISTVVTLVCVLRIFIHQANMVDNKQ